MTADTQTQPTQPTLTSADILGPGGVFASKLPGYESRPAQVRFADAIDEAIGYPGHVIAELGTGTGKSFGYLVPALVAGKQAIISTKVKSLQEQLAQKDGPFLVEHLSEVVGRQITFAVAKGRGNFVSPARVDKLASMLGGPQFDTPEAAAQWPAFIEWFKATETGDLDEINPPLHWSLRDAVNAEDGANEPFVEKMKAAAKKADIIIANHSLFLLDGMLNAKTDGHFQVLPKVSLALIDEAHGLVEVAEQVLGREVSLNGWARLSKRFTRLAQDKVWDKHAEPVATALLIWQDSLLKRLTRAAERQLVLGDEGTFAAPVDLALARFEAQARGQTPYTLTSEERELWTKAADAVASYREAVWMVARPPVGDDPDSIVRYAEQAGDVKRPRIVLNAKPVDVGPYLREYVWERFPTVVATSATLATTGNGGAFRFFRDQAGVPDEMPVIELQAPSPFPYETNSLLYVPDDTAFTADKRKQPERYLDEMAEEVYKLLIASRGRAFVLFTSNQALAGVYRRVAQRLPEHWRIFRQGEFSRTHIVDEFRRADLMDSAPAVLFGTRTFFEGVDLSGRALEMVILDNLPFPVPSEPVYAAKYRRIGRALGDVAWGAFRPFTLPIVTTVLKQVVGRLIRTSTDRGVVAILDRRIVERSYGKTLLKALPPMPLTHTFKDVERVFGEGATGNGR